MESVNKWTQPLNLLYLYCMIMNTAASDRWVICRYLYDNSCILENNIYSQNNQLIYCGYVQFDWSSDRNKK